MTESFLTTQSKRKILFLDLDGTIREPLSEAKFIQHPRDQKIIDGADKAIQRYSDWFIIGITNQGGVAAGHKSLKECIQEQLYTLSLFPGINLIYFCPDYDGLICCEISRSRGRKFTDGSNRWGNFRKPGAGMINIVLNTYDVADALMVGDRAEDEGAAQAAGIKFMWDNEWRSLT